MKQQDESFIHEKSVVYKYKPQGLRVPHCGAVLELLNWEELAEANVETGVAAMFRGSGTRHGRLPVVAGFFLVLSAVNATAAYMLWGERGDRTRAWLKETFTTSPA